MKKTVSIVEDNLLFQQAVANIINDSTEFQLGKIYTSAEEGMDILNNPPDIAIIDIHLPGISGINLISKIREKTRVECLVCSMHDSDEYIFKALESGASGYILKDASIDQILNALMEICRGGAPMSPYIARRVISTFSKPKPINTNNPLTKRELEIVTLLSDGLQYKEIANRLQISIETVKKHMRNIYEKLEVQNKVEALNKYKRFDLN